jgi:pantoate--beta-alanine ligase
MAQWAAGLRAADSTLALVPTMGFFHEGHLALMRRGRELADKVVVSLFVNPIQFGPGEDLDRYPRDFERDRRLAESVGVSALFSPEPVAMYPPGFQTSVAVSGLGAGLCGASRPGHFNGVTTVVAKLFNIVRPDWAIFGEKDFQQLAVIRRMVLDLDWPVKIVGHPIVREADGLAMSSRNVYLRPDEREAALGLRRAILKARELLAAGWTDAAALGAELERFLLSLHGAQIDYVRLVDALTLQEQTKIDGRTRLMLAVRIGGRVRLIDNGALTSSSTEAAWLPS